MELEVRLVKQILMIIKDGFRQLKARAILILPIEFTFATEY